MKKNDRTDSYNVHGLLYTIDGVQRNGTASMLYLRDKVGMTDKESEEYLRMLRVDELQARISTLNQAGRYQAFLET